MTTAKPATVKDSLAAVEPPAHMAAVDRRRRIMRDELPEAEERIGYGIPTYKLGGCAF